MGQEDASTPTPSDFNRGDNLANKLHSHKKSCKYNCLNFRQFYHVTGELGEGAESVVYKCTHL